MENILNTPNYIVILNEKNDAKPWELGGVPYMFNHFHTDPYLVYSYMVQVMLSRTPWAGWLRVAGG